MNRLVIVIFCCLLISITAAPNSKVQTSLEDTVAELEKIAEQNSKGYVKPLVINTQNHSIVCINSSCGIPQDPWNNTYSSVIPARTNKKSKSYHVSSAFKADFLSAQQWCFEYDMKLASIMSNEESERYVNTTRLPSEDHFWIGLTQTMYQGKYVWIKNGEELNYTNWNPGQPDRIKTERCGIASSNTGKWHDAPCSSLYFFVCEKEEE